MRNVSKVLITLLTLLYPLLWWLLHDDPVSLTALGGMMCIVWLCRAVIERGSVSAKTAPYIALLFAICAIAGHAAAFMWYPLMLNLSLLCVFALSLKRTPIIEVFARMRHPDLPAAVSPYLRVITCIWIGYFVFSSSLIVLFSLMRWDRAWALYTGFISYLLMGVLFAGEWLYRTFILKKRLELPHD